MSSETALARLTRSFKMGFLSDRILYILDSAEVTGRILDEDIPILNEVLSHLKQAYEGYSWIDNPIVDATSCEKAFYFGRAVKALSAVVRTPIEFQDRIKEFIETVEQLISTNTSDLDRIKDLRDYFLQISNVELDNTIELLGVGGGYARRLCL